MEQPNPTLGLSLYRSDDQVFSLCAGYTGPIPPPPHFSPFSLGDAEGLVNHSPNRPGFEDEPVLAGTLKSPVRQHLSIIGKT
jgi:hypothetical protein